MDLVKQYPKIDLPLRETIPPICHQTPFVCKCRAGFCRQKTPVCSNTQQDKLLGAKFADYVKATIDTAYCCRRFHAAMGHGPAQCQRVQPRLPPCRLLQHLRYFQRNIYGGHAAADKSGLLGLFPI